MAIAFDSSVRSAKAASVAATTARVPRESLALVLSMTDWALALTIIILLITPAGAGNWLAAPVSAALAALAAGLLFKACLWTFDAYRFNSRFERGVLGALVGACLACGLSLLTGAYGGLWLIAGAASAALHVIGAHLRDHWLREGRFSERLVVVGATPTAREMIRTAQSSLEARVLGVFDDRLQRTPDLVEGAPVLGGIDDLLIWERLADVDHIVIAVSAKAEARVRALIARLAGLPQRVSLLLDFADGEVDMVARKPAMLVSGAAPNRVRAELKRLQDLALGGLILFLATPVMVLIAAAIKLDSPGPVFFRQRRHGFNNRVIDVWKFRTMRAESCAPMIVRQTEKNDPRVTRLGAVLRKTSLDELPQLFNVLGGEMSLVGPRPHAVGMRTGDIESEKLVAVYAHRHRVKPGMTGWAQVHGSRGPMQDAEAVRERISYDLAYIERASFWLDLWIIVKTLPALLGDKLRNR
jgi:Undecaprenyl-phosphate glucose phosphotransferase